LKLINTNIIREFSDLQVDERTGNFGSGNRYVAKPDESSDLLFSQRSSLAMTSTVRRASLSRCKGRSQYFKVDTYQAIESLLTSLGLIIPDQWGQRLRFYHFGVTYNSATHHLYLDGVPTDLQSVRRRFKVHLPAFSFQFQTTSWPRSIACSPIARCRSQIFKLCTEGNIDMVKIWLKNSWTSPFVVNKHGENLLHVSSDPRVLSE
jgi:hypothetical protein